VIFEQSSQLPGLSKAFVKRKIFKKDAISYDAQKYPLHTVISIKDVASNKMNHLNKNVWDAID